MTDDQAATLAKDIASFITLRCRLAAKMGEPFSVPFVAAVMAVVLRDFVLTQTEDYQRDVAAAIVEDLCNAWGFSILHMPEKGTLN